jgi:hypothetical protein
MAVVAAALLDVHTVEGPASSIANATTGARYVYRCTVSCGTMTAGDTAAIVTCDDKIELITKKGKAVTMRSAGAGGPGVTPGATVCYGLDASVSGTTLAFSVGGPTAAAAVAAGATVSIYVTVDEL